jgi:adenosylcobyric acid synthase
MENIKGKSIMIQGTMSSAGKSLIVAGLCRIFKQDGYKVAPFKSQNMALNSYITKEGLEMGRAQVMQAEAAGIEPSVYMNPILLKPTNETGSQVIVNGEVYKNMSARDYFAYKKQLIPDIKYAYEKLASENDIVVIEGAGSPVEINLKADDIVNMGMARIAKSPVLIVGDIDRGGVFAQLCGTMMLLENDEKDMVKGLIINKFRGDKTILEPGIETLEKLAGKKIVGTVPYMELSLEDEDSLTDRFNNKKGTNANMYADIDIAVIKLPHISNFTDFNIWENVEGVVLRYVVRPYELGNPDMIIIPGTKNTIEDLRWLRESGMEANILRRYNNKECVIFGICGGYQMLGESIIDIDGMESSGTQIRGMELIPMVTEFENNKERTQIKGVIENAEGVFSSLNGLEISGYEIHMGNSTVTKPFMKIKDEVTGAFKEDGYSSERVYGTYVHGIFDRHEIVENMVMSLAKIKGIDKPKTHILDYSQYKQLEYDKLADGLRNSLDMDMIYEIIKKGVV